MSSFTEAPTKYADDQLKDHDGTPLPSDADVFVLPPPEIGELISVHTSLKLGQQPRSLWNRLTLCLIVGASIALVGDLISRYAVAKRDQREVLSMIFWIVAICMAALPWYLTRFRHHVSFIGKLGLARCRLTKTRDNPPTSELFLFSTAHEIRTSETRMYHNGVYTGTSYGFSWTNAAGAKVFVLKGQYRSEKGTPKTKDEYWFAKAGEIAWCEYLFDLTVVELEQNGYIEFRLAKQDFVRVGPGFLEFGMRGEVARVTPQEIASLSLNQGTFAIKTHDAGWFGSKGKFSFSYGNMANARLFLLALDRLCGYQFD